MNKAGVLDEIACAGTVESITDSCRCRRFCGFEDVINRNILS